MGWVTAGAEVGTGGGGAVSVMEEFYLKMVAIDLQKDPRFVTRTQRW